MLGSALLLSYPFYCLTTVTPKSQHTTDNTDNTDNTNNTYKSTDIISLDKPPPAPATANTTRIVKHVEYLMVGAGTASFNALEAIKEFQSDPNVLIIGAENVKPYARPPLSKQWWINKDEEIIYTQQSIRSVPNDLSGVEKGVGWIHAKVGRVDVEDKYVVLEDGTKISYGKLLLATGVSPKVEPIFEVENDYGRLHTFQTLADFEKLEKIVADPTTKNIMIIGGGFLGSELASSLAEKVKVVQAFPEKGHFSNVFPEYLSKWTSNQVSKLGVTVMPNSKVTRVQPTSEGVTLTLSSGKTFLADHVIISEGSVPNTQFAKRSLGLEVDQHVGGFLVNAELQARSGIWAAGDCASYYDAHLGRRRIEHHDHAVHTGRVAGANMTGTVTIPYTYKPIFWSDVGPNISFQGVGRVDSNLITVGVWAGDENKEDITARGYERGVVFYCGKDKKIEGVLLWNIDAQDSVARRVIMQGKSIDDVPEVSKWFKIFN